MNAVEPGVNARKILDESRGRGVRIPARWRLEAYRGETFERVND